ncbi:alpha carbonic anhydrase 7 [Manihot esculenta]|uniref:Uncharacterized protein n=1 Tax=Manihot esculenta TaxID=3983 RepID=A0ACB7GYP1_MANES|nr:alpha carbonic anhydrase 7 [Manihot esculenta]KAG8644613.1 hypothetical protein MANES_11G147850v8 [Manihot esculenta]
MEKFAIQLLYSFSFLSLLLHILAAESHQTGEEKEFGYQLNSENGPSRWGELEPEWRTCSNGTKQSPINILKQSVKTVTHLGELDRDYRPSNATLKNKGHDMMLEWESGAGSIEINGKEYVLQQCHWHSPSEHTINGRRFAVEMHMVHKSEDGKVAVVGILFKIGNPESFLSSLRDHLKSVGGTRKAEKVVGVVDPNDIKMSRKYYRYMGSLTTPPCTENVTWTISTKVRTVSKEQVRMIRVAAHAESGSNARPIQATNGRLVQLYQPDEEDD